MRNSSMILLDEIEEFRRRHMMTATSFGLLAVNDGHLIRSLRAGRQPTLGTADAIRLFMRTYKPSAAGRPRRRSKSTAGTGVAA